MARGDVCCVSCPVLLPGGRAASSRLEAKKTGCTACIEEACKQAEAAILSPEPDSLQLGVWQGSPAKRLKARSADSVMSMEDAIEAACVRRVPRPRRRGVQAVCQSPQSPPTPWRPPGTQGGDGEAGNEVAFMRPSTPVQLCGRPGPAGDGHVRRQAFEELLEAREKGRAECIEMACKSAETAGLSRSEVAALRTRFQRLCLTRLEEACRRAEAAGVAAADVSQARAQARGLRSEVRKLQVASELLDARRSGSSRSIREACERAEAAGLQAAEVEALERKLGRLYASCIEEACRRAEAAGVASADIAEARAEAGKLRAAAELLAAKQSCLSLTFSSRASL